VHDEAEWIQRVERGNWNVKTWVAAVVGAALIVLAGVFAILYQPAAERETIDLSDRISAAELSELAAANEAGDGLRFGFDLRASPQEDARQYMPFLEYLERATGYRFDLHFSSEGRIAANLGTDRVQFAAIGADTYLRADAEYGVIPLVRGLNALGRAEYQSMIVVAPHSPIQQCAQLSGKRFAFGSVNSTQGHLIPRIVLTECGVLLDELAAYGYTGSHRNCANAVISGEFDACGMQDTMARELAEAGLVRIIHTSEYYPSSGIAASTGVPGEVLDRVRQALLDFEPQGRDADGLYHWERTEMPNGFAEAREGDYAELRDWAVEFGFLDPAGEEAAP
jgi:phosphonate transport system substrate-binding protein